jgi:4-carboxymuconolactone decarboxylase
LTEPGRARRKRAQGAKADKLQAAMAALDPQLVEWADGFIFGEVWGRPGLSFEERMLVAISQLAATNRPAQLKNYLFGAIEAGIPAVKIHEALVMLTVYTGFPNALGALACWDEVCASLRRRGVDLGDVPAGKG